MKRFAALVLCFLPIPLSALQASPAPRSCASSPSSSSSGAPSLEVLLDRLYAYAAQYRATLPSLSCDESIVSQELDYNGKVKRQVRVTGTMREIRTDDPDDPFSEQHEFLKVNGKRVKKLFAMPYFIQGGFANLIGFHHRELKDCFDYQVSFLNDGKTVQMEMQRKDEPKDAECRTRVFAGSRWKVIADVATGHILHSERTISSQASDLHHEAYFASLDYEPQMLGDRTFWLPARFSAHSPEDDRRMYATYSNCHRYAGEMKILPGFAPIAPAPNPQ
jgi:hypothetical protein